MATLQTTRHTPTIAVRPRLKLVGGASASPVLPAPTTSPAMVKSIPTSAPSPSQLTDLEQHQLLIQTAALFEGWRLVSVQRRANNGVLIAYLIRNQGERDPLQMIRDGNALQIMMDAVGNIKVQHPRRRKGHIWLRWWYRLVARFTG